MGSSLSAIDNISCYRSFLIMSRPLVSVYDTTSAKPIGTVTLPAVFTAPIRGDIVNYVHNLMSKNSRQAYGTFARAGMQVRI